MADKITCLDGNGEVIVLDINDYSILEIIFGIGISTFEIWTINLEGSRLSKGTQNKTRQYVTAKSIHCNGIKTRS